MGRDEVRVIARHDYKARGSKELDIRKGEKLILLDESKSWPKVLNSKNQSGYVPADYIKPKKSSSSDSSRRREKRKGDSKSDSSGPSSSKSSKISVKDFEGKEDNEEEMMKMMGFAGFDSTKGKKVPGNDVSAVHVVPKRKYRQYMNRKGGFNRPLDFVS